MESILSNMPILHPTDRSRHSKSMDNTSLNHSDRFILMIGTYLSLHQVPGSSVNTTHTLLPRSRIPCPCPGQIHNKFNAHRLNSNSAIMSNNFVSLLSDI